MLGAYAARDPQGYKLYAESLEPDPVPGSRLITLVRYDIPRRPIRHRTRLETQAFRVMANREVSVCNVYVAHGHNFTYELRSLTNQLPKSHVILWDFNAHNVLWGSENTNGRGRVIEDFIVNNEICVLNTGEATLKFRRRLPSINLSSSSPEIVLYYEWTVIFTEATTSRY